MADLKALNDAKVHLERALEDLEAAAADEGNMFVQDCPRVHHAAEELRAAKRKIADHELDLDLKERQK